MIVMMMTVNVKTEWEEKRNVWDLVSKTLNTDLIRTANPNNVSVCIIRRFFMLFSRLKSLALLFRLLLCCSVLYFVLAVSILVVCEHHHRSLTNKYNDEIIIKKKGKSHGEKSVSLIHRRNGVCMCLVGVGIGVLIFSLCFLL